MNEQMNKPGTTFWIISVLALIWNLLGVMNFIGQTFMSDEALAALPPEQQELFQSVPSWMTVVFAVAVLTGTLGSLGLLLRKAWAVPLLLVSLIAVILQMGYSLFLTNMVEVMGTPAVVTSTMVIIFAIFLYFYSKKCRDKGWLT